MLVERTPKLTVVPTGEALRAMARVIDQCSSVGIEYRLVGFDHPWETIAVALDTYFDRHRVLGHGLEVIVAGYALAWGALVALEHTLVTEFSIAPVLDPGIRYHAEFTSYPGPVHAFMPEMLRACWTEPDRIPMVNILGLNANHWILCDGRREGPVRFALADADGHGRVTIPLMRDQGRANSGSAVFRRRAGITVRYALEFEVHERVVGLAIALFGHLVTLNTPR